MRTEDDLISLILLEQQLLITFVRKIIFFPQKCKNVQLYVSRGCNKM